MTDWEEGQSIVAQSHRTVNPVDGANPRPVTWIRSPTWTVVDDTDTLAPTESEAPTARTAGSPWTRAETQWAPWLDEGIVNVHWKAPRDEAGVVQSPEPSVQVRATGSPEGNPLPEAVMLAPTRPDGAERVS